MVIAIRVEPHCAGARRRYEICPARSFRGLSRAAAICTVSSSCRVGSLCSHQFDVPWHSLGAQIGARRRTAEESNFFGGSGSAGWSFLAVQQLPEKGVHLALLAEELLHQRLQIWMRALGLRGGWSAAGLAVGPIPRIA